MGTTRPWWPETVLKCWSLRRLKPDWTGKPFWNAAKDTAKHLKNFDIKTCAKQLTPSWKNSLQWKHHPWIVWVFQRPPNAKCMNIQKNSDHSDAYLWTICRPGQPNTKQMESPDRNSDCYTGILSSFKDLKKAGMNFVSPTIIYAYMQAIGMVSDHTQRLVLL